MLAGVGFDSRTAGGVARQAGAALGALVVHVQVVTDVRFSVSLFLWERKISMHENQSSVLYFFFIDDDNAQVF